MDVLFGFLIGLAYPSTLVIIIASMVTARSGSGVIAAVTSLLLVCGPIVWIMTFIAFGFGAGLAAFAGWFLGLGLAALLATLVLASRFRGRNSRSRPPWKRQSTRSH